MTTKPTQPKKPTISKTIRLELRRCGLTQAQVAKKTRINESVLSRFRNGAELRSKNLDRLARYLGIEAVPTREWKDGGE